jgi:hypothetical protein
MEIKVKIFGTGPDRSGCVIPMEVMEEALKKPVTTEWVHLGASDRMVEDLSTIAGKLQKVEVDTDGAFATVETLQTPSGQILEKVITEMGSDNIEVMPRGYCEKDENGVINKADIIGFDIEPRR